MTKGKARELDYVEVPIHQDFYYNRELGLPTVIHQFERLEKTLVESHYLACITVPSPQSGTRSSSRIR